MQLVVRRQDLARSIDDRPHFLACLLQHVEIRVGLDQRLSCQCIGPICLRILLLEEVRLEFCRLLVLVLREIRDAHE